MSSQCIGIVGGGLMGAGIAVKFALARHEVLVFEASPERRATLPAVIASILQELSEAGVLNTNDSAAAQNRIRLIDGLPALAGASFVIEAIPEILEAKRTLYRQLEAVLAPDVLIGSNTSGLMPDDLSAGFVHPERFLIAHFWNPPHAIPLVEVVPGTRTSSAFVEKAMTTLRAIGSEPVLLKKAVPGFIGNRIQFAVLREALHLIQTGVANAETIDTVIKASLGRRYGIVGPLEAADLGGLETFQRISTNLWPDLAADSRSLEVLREHVTRGETGAASGQGFYRWTEERRQAIRQKRIAHQLKRVDSA